MSACVSISNDASVQDKENERLRQIIREREAQIEVLQQAHLSSIEILSSNFSRLEHIVNEFCDLLNNASRCRASLPEDDIRLQLQRTMSVAQVQNKRLRQRIAKWRSFVESGADDWFGSPENIMVLVDHKELLRDIQPYHIQKSPTIPLRPELLTCQDGSSSESLLDPSLATTVTPRSRNNSSATSDTYISSPEPNVPPLTESPETPVQQPKVVLTPRTSSLTSLSVITPISAPEAMASKRQSLRQSRSATTRMITTLKKSMSRRGPRG